MRFVRVLTALLVTAALAGACGDDPTSSAPPPEADAPTNNDVPQRIVSLGPTATEMLFAVGAGDQVVAAEEHSTFPPEAPTTDLSGFAPNLEAIVDYEPDLVVLTNDQDDIVAGLDRVGIETLLLPEAGTLDDVYAEIAELGVVTGHEDEAAAVVAGMRSAIDDLVAQVPERPEPLTYYHELDDQLYTATSQTFIGEIYRLAGLENVADPADADGQAGGYPRLSPEFLVAADPDLIFTNEDPATLAARPGFGELSAVESGRVIALRQDISSRWGPRIVEFLKMVVEASTEVPVG
ncbi:ABC transporter substrate-binding protein [soil metagenome]